VIVKYDNNYLLFICPLYIE